jgi:hypothetical protein
MRTLQVLSLAAVLTSGAAVVFAAEGAGAVSQIGITGPYSVTLKVLPAEPFNGPKAAMVWDGGAAPAEPSSASKPNRHMVAFIENDGKPVEDARVVIRYRSLDSPDSPWITLPVARMHVAGKSRLTEHFGNNVRLAPGSYEAEVSVEESRPAVIRFTLPTAD